ncbi:hypothetical protein [Rhizobium leguminosarum]|uniref:hypothetical protein n=1 Tax=Rhizobium leguminosarum TaxID=384 RepID=UPI002E0F09DB|nr:hypothetical protein U8Q02_40190 [Rhizobium leguminosarum]
MKSGVEIEWMSWDGCLGTDLDSSSTAVIWILNPGMKPFPRRAAFETSLAFWDRSELPPLDHLIASLFGRWPEACCAIRRALCGDNGGWPWRPPLSHDAEAVKGFVDDLPAYVSRVVVACEFGISRSRAVAEWIAASVGTTAIGNRAKGEPNARLSDLLFSA